MTKNLSGKKRLRQSEKKKVVNQATKSKIKTVVKKAKAVIETQPTTADDIMRQAVKIIDQAAAKGVLHANTAARKKSRLAKKLNEAKKKEQK